MPTGSNRINYFVSLGSAICAFKGSGIWLIIFMCLGWISCNRNPGDRMIIATASNVKFAMDTLSLLFEKETGIATRIISGSSGKLTAQIQRGAPFDVFFSADMKYPEEVYRNGYALSPPRIYARGSLVLWTNMEYPETLLDLLCSERVERIAIANPRNAPYGKAAMEYLRNSGIYKCVEHKLVFGESISQVNQFLVSGTAEVGFTAKSVVLSPEMTGKGNWIDLEPSAYIPIDQGVVIVSRDPLKITQAEKLLNFMFSDTARKILASYGYKEAPAGNSSVKLEYGQYIGKRAIQSYMRKFFLKIDPYRQNIFRCTGIFISPGIDA